MNGPNGPAWARMGPAWARMGPHGPAWARMGPHGPAWAMDRCGTRTALEQRAHTARHARQLPRAISRYYGCPSPAAFLFAVLPFLRSACLLLQLPYPPSHRAGVIFHVFHVWNRGPLVGRTIGDSLGGARREWDGCDRNSRSICICNGHQVVGSVGMNGRIQISVCARRHHYRKPLTTEGKCPEGTATRLPLLSCQQWRAPCRANHVGQPWKEQPRPTGTSGGKWFNGRRALPSRS